ncbi:MAG TPA: GDSL-type esterase/lipase family protein [Chitinophagaceae bacterium]
MKTGAMAFLLVASFCSTVVWGQGVSDSVKVYNAGVNGNSTTNLLARLDRDVLSKSPELVVLMVGTNDMLNENKTLTIGQYEKNYQELITRIRSKADVVLMTIPPVYAPYLAQRKPQFRGDEKTPPARVDSANNVIRGLAAKNNCVLIDLNRILAACGGANTEKEGLFQNEANSGMADGVHPTANGYKVVAAAVYQTILSHKPGVKSVVCFGDSITNGYRMAGQGTTGGDTYPAILNRMMNP